MSPFQSFADHYKPIIESAMTHYISFGLTDNRSVLEKAMRHSVQAGGKRLRPLLTLATYQLFDPSNVTQVLPLACALELLHTYSLIHDDLPSMDNDDLRRGLPTCHIQYGEDIAILAGDTLNTYSFELISTHLPFPSDRIVRVIREFASACGIHGMSGGQVLDLKGVSETSNEAYVKTTHALKTGALISASVTLPAILAGATPNQLGHLKAYGDAIGLLFQIGDDILDVTGDESTLGKTPNKDVDQHKLTYIRVFGLEKTRSHLSQTAAIARQHLAQLPEFDTALLHDVIHYVEKRTS